LIGDDALEPAIIVLERFHLGDVADFHAAELRFPDIKRSRADAVAAAEILGRDAGLVLFEDGDDLRLGEPGLFHGWSPSRPVASEFSTYFRSLFQATRQISSFAQARLTSPRFALSVFACKGSGVRVSSPPPR
jgi:hypothetical protein